jgi:PadR family transcriptional regulator, regulatory protein PadR
MTRTATSRHSQLLKGVLDVCLLAVIAEEPAYGYEMTKRLTERGLSTVGAGSIYPVLGRLERDGLVETFQQVSNGGPPRKYYRLTPAGQHSLKAWKAEWQSARAAVDGVLEDTNRRVTNGS